MSRNWKKSFSWLVLVSFIALLAPKSLWHDCVHDHISKEVSKDHQSDGKTVIKQGVEKCSVCDLHIPQLSAPLTAYHLNYSNSCDFHAFGFTSDAEKSASSTTFLRGPPALV